MQVGVDKSVWQVVVVFNWRAKYLRSPGQSGLYERSDLQIASSMPLIQ